MLESQRLNPPHTRSKRGLRGLSFSEKSCLVPNVLVTISESGCNLHQGQTVLIFGRT